MRFMDVAGIGMIDLHDFADPDPEVVLRRAHAVNDNGQVAIMGWRDFELDGEPDVLRSVPPDIGRRIRTALA